MRLFLLFFLFFTSPFFYAQVGIGTITPNSKSMLDISSTSDGGTTYKGLMPPVVLSNTERDAINPGYQDYGLLVFVQSSGCLQIWDGDTWENIRCVTIATPEVWINELHYDNMGLDVDEGLEIAGEAGIDLSDYLIVLYNGASGNKYGTDVTLSGIIDNESNGFGAVKYMYTSNNSIQNGPDGIVLFKISTNSVIQFLSYEGVFTANNGPAVGITSIDIGVRESNTTTPVGTSMQLIGTGNEYSEFTWTSGSISSMDTLNVSQVIN